MKTEYKAVIASVVVIALALSVVGSVSYSWFSDSDSSDVTIDWATVDVDMSFSGFTSSNVDTTATIDGDGNIDIDRLMPNVNLTGTFTITNGSNIDTICRIYLMLISGDTSNVENNVSVGLSKDGTAIRSPTLLNAATTSDDISANHIVMMDWTRFSTGEPTGTYTFTISVADGMDTSGTTQPLKMKLVLEAYQADYEVPMSGGSATITSDSPNVVGDVQLGSTGQTVRVGVSFNEAAASEVDGQKLKVTATSGTGDSGFQISGDSTAYNLEMTMDDDDVDSFGTDGLVTITATVPVTGDPGDDISVVHKGTGDQPTLVSHSYDASAGTLTVTFTTSHFSDFIIVTGDKVTVSTETALISSLKAGMDVTLGADITRTLSLKDAIDSNGRYMSDSIVITKESSLDLAGHTLTNYNLHLNGSAYTFTLTDSGPEGTGKMVYDGLDLPAIEDQDDSPYSPTGYLVSVWEGANAVIEGGTFENNIFACVYAAGGTVTINDGTFQIIRSSINGSLVPSYTMYTLNLLDASYSAGTADIIVNGGSFVDYDPTQSYSENPVKNYVSEGHEVTTSEAGGFTIYTVTSETVSGQ